MIFRTHLQHRTARGSMLPVSASFGAAPTSGASMKVQHQRHALSVVMAGFVLLLAGCANGTAAAAPSTSAAAATTSPATSAPVAAAPAPTTTAKLGVDDDSLPGCAARAMAKGIFNPACDEYQGYLDPGTAGGREPTSGEIQRQNLCRTGQLPKTEC
jgi:hypothetical protein